MSQEQDDFETPSVNTFQDAVEHQTQNQNNNLDDAPVSTNADPKDGDEVPDGVFKDLHFYLAQEDGRQDLEELVKNNGGSVMPELPSGKSNQELVVSRFNTTNLPTVTPNYIKSCCENKVLMKVQSFLVPYDEFRAVIDTQLQSEGADVAASSLSKVSDNADTTANATVVSEAVEQQGSEHEGKIEGQNQENTPGSTSGGDPGAPDVVTSNGGNGINDVEKENTKNSSTASESNGESNGDNNGSPVNGGNSGANEPSRSPAKTEPVAPQRHISSHNKSSFTDEEDEFILEVVRKNPTRRTTHTLYDEISRFVPNHTGNSIRHRYRVYLAKRLNYVYEVDENGKLVRDEKGDLIKTTVLPKSLKNKFTASEDYALSLEIKRQFYRDLYQVDPDTGKSLIMDDDAPNTAAKRSLTMDSSVANGAQPSFKNFRVGERRGPVPREFFKVHADRYPTHTENAWRDRFRKFLLTFGIDKYIEYYENEIAQDRVPEAMKNLTNRPKRPGAPTPGNYNSVAKKVKDLTHQQHQQVTALAAASNGAIDANSLSFALPEGDLLDEETLNFISGLKRDLSKIESAGGMAFEYPQDIAESIRNDFTHEESQFDNIDPENIPFPPQLASNELFMPQFFSFPNTKAFLDKVNEIISRDYEPSQAEKLVQDLCDDVGVRKTFSTSILTALSGDLMVFPRYFLCMFRFNSNPPLNIPGIWTREDDEMLRTGDESKIKTLAQKHGVGRIEMRKRFIASDLV